MHGVILDSVESALVYLIRTQSVMISSRPWCAFATRKSPPLWPIHNPYMRPRWCWKCGLAVTLRRLPFMSTFVLEKMCKLCKTNVRTDRGFKEVHLTAVAKALLEHYGADFSSTQVHTNLRKWRVRWLTVSRHWDLSGAQWCDDTKSIIFESEHYHEHVTVSILSATFVALQHWSLSCTITHSQPFLG
jgi:hypothetical protein